MAALLDLILLHRHELPGLPAPRSGRRPTLRATWHIGAGGRPVCTWVLDTGDPDQD